MRKQTSGFSLGELILAIALLGLAVLALLSVVGSVLKSCTKSSLNTIGMEVARTQLQRTISSALRDSPEGSRELFWENEYVTTPLSTGTVKISRTDFDYKVYAQTINDVDSGNPLGTGTANANRIKKVDVVVSWLGGSRQEMGKTETQLSRLVNEIPAEE
jgi:type II secretory pathway pseudopilin PulG